MTGTATSEPEPVPYASNLDRTDFLAKWVPAPGESRHLEPYEFGYNDIAKLVRYESSFAPPIAGGVRRILDQFPERFGISPDRVSDYVGIGLDKIEVITGGFRSSDIISRLQERNFDHIGDRSEYRIFQRKSDVKGYPIATAVTDGRIISTSVREKAIDPAVYFDLVRQTGNQQLSSYALQDEYTRLAYAPMADVHYLESDRWSLKEARNIGGAFSGMRMRVRGFRFENSMVKMKYTAVFNDENMLDSEAIQSDLDDWPPLFTYDWNLETAGRVAMIRGTTPIDEWDVLQDGTPGQTPTSSPTPVPDRKEVQPPRGTEWKFETDYDRERTRIVYASGPSITHDDLLGVAINNRDLFDTQFRVEYDTIEPGDSISVRTPPELAGKHVTISWLTDEPYFVLADYELPDRGTLTDAP